MNVKKSLPLVIALVLGVISARMVVKIIQSKPGENAQGPKMTKVVVAARDIAIGQDLESADLETTQIPSSAAAKGAVYSNPDDLIGRVAIAPLVHGQAVTESLLASNGSGSGLQAAIPTGMRAVTVEVNEISGVAGYITPGCHVDIDLTLKDDLTSQMINRCLVQNVPVTAVGTRSITGQPNPDLARSVTLLVTPRQAELIDLASTYGKPRLVLRNGQDHATAELSTVTVAELTGPHVTISLPPAAILGPIRPADPFAASTTQPALQTASSNWSVRVITAGEQNLVNLRIATPAGPPSVTNSDVKDATAP